MDKPNKGDITEILRGPFSTGHPLDVNPYAILTAGRLSDATYFGRKEKCWLIKTWNVKMSKYNNVDNKYVEVEITTDDDIFLWDFFSHIFNFDISWVNRLSNLHTCFSSTHVEMNPEAWKTEQRTSKSIRKHQIPT